MIKPGIGDNDGAKGEGSYGRREMAPHSFANGMFMRILGSEGSKVGFTA